jgi:RNA polymerase subunit RPABC4/transcription elongation factor Spt4
MFNDVIRTLKRLNRQTISIPLEADEKGYIDKQCPSKDCEFLFKVHADDWTNIFKDEAVWCPMCRHEAHANEWYSIAQVEHVKKQALKVVKEQIHNAFVSGAESFNRRQPKNNFFTMSMKVSGGRRLTKVIPAAAAEEMQLEIQCEECRARFAVIGSAFFCPLCGHNSVLRTYNDSLAKIQAKCDNQEVIRQALTASAGKDIAEVTCRSLLESCISDGVVAFQKYCEGLYSTFGETPFNAFQRLDQGSQLWKCAVGFGYSEWLTEAEFASLKILFQKRHLLAHNEGIIDEKYIQKSGDNSYRKGQRIVVSKSDITDLLNCLRKLGEKLKFAKTDK